MLEFSDTLNQPTHAKILCFWIREYFDDSVCQLPHRYSLDLESHKSNWKYCMCDKFITDQPENLISYICDKCGVKPGMASCPDKAMQSPSAAPQSLFPGSDARFWH